MKKLSLLFVLNLVLMAAFAQDQVLGMYWTPKKDGKIHIYKEGAQYFGKIVPTNNNGRKDDNNPDEKLRSRPLAGLAFLQNFTYKNGQWEGGTIYDPDNGKTYSSTMWFEGKDLIKLNLRGFIGFSFLGRTAVFERVQ